MFEARLEFTAEDRAANVAMAAKVLALVEHRPTLPINGTFPVFIISVPKPRTFAVLIIAVLVAVVAIAVWLS
jgi:hypothetical protein